MNRETIFITGVGSEMQGVGRLSDGRAVFVPFAIPGETVDVQIEAEKERFCTARLLDVREPSPDRVVPVCPHYGVCGGCQTQHIAYARALSLKRQKVVDALSRLGWELQKLRDQLNDAYQRVHERMRQEVGVEFVRPGRRGCRSSSQFNHM